MLKRLLEVYSALGSEIWKAWPWDVARLTDWQIVHWYIEPQLKRQEALKQQSQSSGGSGMTVPEDPGPDWKPPPQFMIATLMQLGMSKEQAIAEYAAQEKANAEYQKQQGR